MSSTSRPASWVLLTWLLLLPCPRAWALNPALDVSQYGHTVWRVRDGFAKGRIASLAQTPDGFLWLGTEFGLLRFDGVRTTSWQPAAGQSLPDTRIRSLFVARDGTLWIGTQGGLASFARDQLATYPELEGLLVNGFAQDQAGTVWVSATFLDGPALFCAIRDARAECSGKDRRFGAWVASPLEDRHNNLWVPAASGLWRWQPGTPHLYSVPDGVASVIHPLTGNSTGGILVLTVKGVDGIVDGKLREYWVPSPALRWHPTTVFTDGDGAVWIGTFDRGLVHLHDGITDEFGMVDGLSDDNVTTIYEDREKNIWVADAKGLDRFRALAATTYSARQGVMGYPGSVVTDRNGSIWFSTTAGLYNWDGSHFTVYRAAHKPLSQSSSVAWTPSVPVIEVPTAGLPESAAGSLCQDREDRVWLGTSSGLGYLEHKRFIIILGVPSGYIDSIAEDRDGHLWIAHRDSGLYEISSGRVVRQIPWTSISRNGPASRVVADSARGGLWLGFRTGGVAHLVDGQLRASYGPRDGLGKGRINGLRLSADGTVWVATEGGLSRVRAGQVATLSTRDGMPCDNVHWSIEVGDSLWVYTACGLVRIAAKDIKSWSAEVEHTKTHESRVPMMVLDESDGIASLSAVSSHSRHVAVTTDGRLWFATQQGLTTVDPRNLPFNKLPPRVHVERIVADRQAFGVAPSSSPAQLPPLSRDLEIDYTALSLVAPEKILFRYKLEGRDRDWQDVGNRRQAFYSDLPPGNYRFHVIASNNSGVWNQEGDALAFSIAPAYWQTNWFRALCAIGGALAALALVRFRVRQVAARVRGRLEERMAERERIARDLHDTLLQGMQGLLLRFQVAADHIPQGEPARQMMDRALERADEVLDEGRARVKGLRAPVGGVPRLPQAIASIVERLAPADASPFRITVEGAVRELDPIVREEVQLVAREALTNAYRHANANKIEAEIAYADHGLTVRIRDNGQGIDPAVLREGRPGHFGLVGMRERAKKLRARLGIWSKPGAGTEVEVCVPAAIAYRQPTRRVRRKPWWRKGAAPGTEDVMP